MCCQRPQTAAELTGDDAVYAAVGQWMLEAETSTMEERRAAAHAFRELLKKKADAVVAGEETLESATEGLHAFCERRYPEALRYNKMFCNLDCARRDARQPDLAHPRRRGPGRILRGVG